MLQKAGDEYRKFKLTKILPIPEIQCVLKELEHIPTGAQVMAIENDDPQNLFCLSFKTWPESSNGVAHILEHVVLCGSEKYPVKDPLFSMSRRSLNTFLNALTGSDFTCYPAASQVPQDFYNLLEVYMDAVFKPLLKDFSFKQEGHRLEYTIPEDPTSPLIFKGVVFNEMKGALTSSVSRLNEKINETLFPDLTYGVNSGGNPHEIPFLTYEKLKEFHQQFYHPSRCLYFFYGNLPLEKNLDFIAEKTLDKAKRVEQLPEMPKQPRFKEPRRVRSTYPVGQDDEGDSQAMIGYGWLTIPVLDQKEWLALSVLELALLDTDASPLKRALLDSGLCKSVACYMDGEISEVPLVIILRGCEANKADELEQVLRNSLKQIIQDGIPSGLIDNAIHQLEFFRSEITGDQSPYGLSLFFRSALLKQHNGKPEDGLKIHSLFTSFREKVANDSKYLVGLIKKHLLDNTHFVSVVMEPDKNLGAQENVDERKILDAMQAGLSEEQKKKIIKDAEIFAKYQESEDDNIEVLPKITLKDIPKQTKNYELAKSKLNDLNVFHYDGFTNEIVYADINFDLPDMPYEDLAYLRLFTVLASQVGCGNRSWSENLEYIQAHTGGAGLSMSLNMQARDFNKFYPSLNISGKSLHRKADRLFPLIGEMATALNFSDKARLKELVLKHYTGLQSTLNQSALRYAINLSASKLNVASKIANEWFGLEYFFKIRELAQDFDEKVDGLLETFKKFNDKILCVGRHDLVVSCSQKFFENIVSNHFWGIDQLPKRQGPEWLGNYPLVDLPSQCRTIASPVAFVGKVFKTVNYIDPDSPALGLSAHLFDNLTLHAKIREQGGAYGAGAVSNALSGNYYFYSYRDPHIASTMETFDEAVEEVVRGDFDEEDLQEAKLEMIQALDIPVSPGSRGDLAYGWHREGRTRQLRQAFRDKLLSLTPKDIISAVEKHIVPNMKQGSTVVFAGRELIDKENALLEAAGNETLPIHTV